MPATSISVTAAPAQLRKLAATSKKAANAVDLIYISEYTEGIVRKKKGKDFSYSWNRKNIKDKATLKRIFSLVIPPAWTDVWICPVHNGHLQATGIDAAGRKQYKYHPAWIAIRSESKFYQLRDLGKALPKLRKHLKTALAQPGLRKEKVLAVMVETILETGIRIGNEAYKKQYGSYGISTLRDKHVDFKNGLAVFRFKGKKGVYQRIELNDKKLARLVKKCKEIPGQELFQYYDEDGKRHSIESGMVNGYIKELCGGSFTAKDLRTWRGTVCALSCLKDHGCCSTKKETKQKTIDTLDTVASLLGNTRTVCKKYYVHPRLLELYEDEKLERYFTKAKNMRDSKFMSKEEKLLLQILK